RTRLEKTREAPPAYGTGEVRLSLPERTAFGISVTLTHFDAAAQKMRSSSLPPHLVSTELAHTIRASIGHGDAIDYAPLLAQFQTVEDLVMTLANRLKRAGVKAPEAVAHEFVHVEASTVLLSKRLTEPLRTQARHRAREAVEMLDLVQSNSDVLDGLLDALRDPELDSAHGRAVLSSLGIQAHSSGLGLLEFDSPLEELRGKSRADGRETLRAWTRDSRKALHALSSDMRNTMFQRDMVLFLGADATDVLDLEELGIHEMHDAPRTAAHVLLLAEYDRRDPDEARAWVGLAGEKLILSGPGGLGWLLAQTAAGSMPGYLEQLVEAERLEKKALLGLGDPGEAGRVRSAALLRFGMELAAARPLEAVMETLRGLDDLPMGKRVAWAAEHYDRNGFIREPGDYLRDEAIGVELGVVANSMTERGKTAESDRAVDRLALASANAIFASLEPKPTDILRGMGLNETQRLTVLTLYGTRFGDQLPTMKARNPKGFSRRLAEDLRALATGLGFLESRV
ncbi:MAG: hypothetical protein AAFY60_13380, partial [Myxococcota bacterium]